MAAIPTGATETTAAARTTSAWHRLLLAATATVIVSNLTVQVLARTIIPPLALVTLLTLIGLALYSWRQRVGIAVLGGVGLLWALGSLGFAADHLSHPESGIDFVHAVIELFGHATIAIAALAAWRGGSTRTARRVGYGAAAVLVAAIVVGAAASIATAGDTPAAGDVAATVEHAEFPEDLQVASGGSLYVENADLFRHTFTVEGTDIDAELASNRGTRVAVDLPPGTYDVICTVPGHEFMGTTLEVE